MALFGNRKVEQLERELSNLRSVLPDQVFQGKTVEFVEDAPRSILPWKRNGRGTVYEAAQTVTAPARAGYLGDIPRGGSTEYNQGYAQIGGATDRRTLMNQMQQLYVACVWAKSCVDTIARTCSAGGMSIEPDDETDERKETITLSPQAQKAQNLFDFVNPEQNFRQLLRQIFTDLLIYGDSFIEVVWALGEPIALYSLPCPDMLIEADEHGVVKQYIQRTETDRRAVFEPHEVLHFKFDSPRAGLYGLGPTEGNVHPITTWLFTEGLLKATMEKGNPANLAISWDINLADNEIKKYSGQHRTRNMGPANVGNLIDLKGDTKVQELHANAIAEYMATKAQCRDEICGGYGTPPAMVTIIESGNLGGGTGSSQFKSFQVNTCGPLKELVLEVLTFSILGQGFGVTDFRCRLDEIDWRDDAVIEEVSHLRVTDGRWTINRGRDAINEPPVDGGDDAVIIQTRDVVLVKDLAAMSEAAVEKASATPTMPGQAPGAVPGPAEAPVVPDATGAPDAKPPAHAKADPTESLLTESATHSGAMVALFLPSKVAQDLAIDGGEPGEDMHVTLAYLGAANDLGDTDALAAVIAAWALETPPITADISGVGLFNPQGDENPPVTYASVDAPTLSGARHRLIESLKRSGFPPDTEHGFTPHCTLAYANVVDQVPACDDSFTFGAVTLAIAGERQSWPLQGTTVESLLDEASFTEAFQADFATRRAQAMKELPKVGV
jgi:2'-5' RNA ligase